MKGDQLVPSPRKTTRRLSATGFLALTWVMVVLGLYYWVHKPITPALARAVGGAAVDGLTTSVMVLLAGGVGRLALRSVDTAHWSLAERVAAPALVGLCITSLAIFGVGVWALSGPSMILLGIVLGVIARRDILAWGTDSIRLIRTPPPSGYWNRVLAGIVVSLILIAALLTLLLPTKWDVLTYHLVGPEHYVERGRFYAVPHNHFLGFPQLVETIFSAQLALTGQLTGASMLHWAIGVLVLLITGGYVARYSEASTGWLAAGILLAGKSFWLETTFAYVDLMPIGLAIIALGLADLWRDQHTRDGNDGLGGISARLASRGNYKIIIWLGALAGFGLGVKYSVLWLGVSLALFVIWLSRGERWLTRVSELALFCLAALLVFAPWMIRNVRWYGNPLYPFVLETAEMDAVRHEWYNQPQSGLAYSEDAWQIPVLPLTATFLGVEGKGSYGTDIGPLYLMLLPLLLLVRQHLTAPQRGVISRTLFLVAIVLALWGLSSVFGSYISLQTRLIFYVLGPLAIVSAIAYASLQQLPKKPFDLHFVLRAMIIMALTLTLIDAMRYLNTSGMNYYFSGEDDFEQVYLEHALGWHYVTMRQISELPAGTGIRFLWEPRYLYCDEPRITCYTDSLMDAWYYARRTIDDGSPGVIAKVWQGQAWDYLLVYEFGRMFEQENAVLYQVADWIAWQEFEQQYLVEVWRNGSTEAEPQYILYRWRQ